MNSITKLGLASKVILSFLPNQEVNHGSVAKRLNDVLYAEYGYTHPISDLEKERVEASVMDIMEHSGKLTLN